MTHATSAPGRVAWHGRGREAKSPDEIPAPGWKDILIRVKESLASDRLSIISAGVAFYAVLAVFPAIGAIISLYGLFLDPGQISDQLSAFRGVLPGEAFDLLSDQLHGIASAQSSTLSIAAIGALIVTLWSASAGVKTLMEALNVAYKEKEKRGFLRRNGVALLLTFGSVLGGAIALAIVVALPAIVALADVQEPLATILMFTRWPVLAVAMMIALAVIYRFGPSRDEARWSWVNWGAAIATALWLGGSGVFSYYATHFGNYNKTYGSVAAMVVLLMWFLLTAYVVLIGAEINAEMERQTKKDPMQGEPKPLGQRGAHAADTVGRTP